MMNGELPPFYAGIQRGLTMIHRLTPEQVKNLNKLVLLEHIRLSRGGISRAELARRIGRSRAAVSTIVNDFLRQGILIEVGQGASAGGRRAVLLQLNPARGYLIGVDLGVTHYGLLITDLAGQVRYEVSRPWQIADGPRPCLDAVRQLVQESLSAAGVPLQAVLACGVGVPGPINIRLGGVVNPPVMPGWDGYPIRAELEGAWNCPVYLENDANLGALGEWTFGAGRDTEMLVYIKVGSGVGAGVVYQGQIVRGETGSAGEIGHVTVLADGPRCRCGNQGCLEALAGGQALAAQAAEAVQSGVATQLSLLAPPEQLTAREVGLAARRGDLVAQQLLSQAGRYLGLSVANLVNLLNPGLVVVGGGVAQVGDLLLDPLRQTVRRRTMAALRDTVRITSASLGRRSTALGAIALAMQGALAHLAA